MKTLGSTWKAFAMAYKDKVILFSSFLLPLVGGFVFAFPFMLIDTGKVAVVFFEGVVLFSWWVPLSVFLVSFSENRRLD